MQVDAKPITCQLKVKERTSTLFVLSTDTQYYMQDTQHSVRAWFPKSSSYSPAHPHQVQRTSIGLEQWHSQAGAPVQALLKIIGAEYTVINRKLGAKSAQRCGI